MAKILAVDDERESLEIVKRAFRSSGHEVVTAVGGDAAMELFSGTSFDVALVDYRMPGASGLQVLMALRDRQPACVRVLMSGALELPIAVAAVNRGEVSRLIEKPFQVEELVAVLDEALQARSRLEQIERRIEHEHTEQQRCLLRECLVGDVVRLALQPIVRTTDDAVVAYEALLRSTHRVLSDAPTMLLAAEQTNMIAELSHVIANRAREVLERMRPDALMFMNLHPSEFAEPERLTSTLECLHAHSGRVVIEITERRSVLELAGWRSSVATLTHLGYALAVDDLGAGYSSLSVLAEIEPQYMKVDMSIVRDIHKDARKRRLVELLCRFAEMSNSKLIAEGVEVKEEADALRSIGVHFLQGYYFGRPSFTF